MVLWGIFLDFFTKLYPPGPEAVRLAEPLRDPDPPAKNRIRMSLESHMACRASQRDDIIGAARRTYLIGEIEATLGCVVAALAPTAIIIFNLTLKVWTECGVYLSAAAGGQRSWALAMVPQRDPAMQLHRARFISVVIDMRIIYSHPFCTIPFRVSVLWALRLRFAVGPQSPAKPGGAQRPPPQTIIFTRADKS